MDHSFKDQIRILAYIRALKPHILACAATRKALWSRKVHPWALGHVHVKVMATAFPSQLRPSRKRCPARGDQARSMGQTEIVKDISNCLAGANQTLDD